MALGLMRSALRHLGAVEPKATSHLQIAIDSLSQSVPRERELAPDLAALIDAMPLSSPDCLSP